MISSLCELWKLKKNKTERVVVWVENALTPYTLKRKMESCGYGEKARKYKK